MKGEKGIPGVSLGDGVGEELGDDSFCEYFENILNFLRQVKFNLFILSLW